MTSGGYGNIYPPIKAEQHALEAMRCDLPGIAASLPILQGGKRPDEILTYRAFWGVGGAGVRKGSPEFIEGLTTSLRSVPHLPAYVRATEEW